MTALDRTLVTIAQGFRENQILYGIGGSRLLQFHGIPMQPHDLDFIIDIADFDKAVDVLKSIGNPIPFERNERYRTGKFSRFDVHGVEVDLIADFTISYHDTLFTYPFSEECLCAPFSLGRESVFACRLEDWYLLYNLMNDPKRRVDLIASHFRQNGHFDTDRFRSLLPDPNHEFDSLIQAATSK